jgi:hypothetical protein
VGGKLRIFREKNRCVREFPKLEKAIAAERNTGLNSFQCHPIRAASKEAGKHPFYLYGVRAPLLHRRQKMFFC